MPRTQGLRLLQVILALAPVVGAACDDRAPRGLRDTPPGTGPAVVFDLFARPLPEIPAPNDAATVADPTSRTGRRINPSQVAPSYLEQTAREAIAELEGWGTFAPIQVSFAPGAGAHPGEPAIDLARLRSKMQRDHHRFDDDPVYVINLKTGVPVPLDLGDGDFPVTIRDRDNYYANDEHADSWTVLFETHEEGAGLTQAAYTPARDLDFDGVLDHPNSLGPIGTGADGVLSWYERETDTLILRPVVPLEGKTEYAVVLTDRLAGPDGQPVRSPFPAIHHPSQRAAVERVQAVLADAARQNYYGDVAGTGLDHVAFAWSFTTAPVVDDLFTLRDGLFGTGPFGWLAREFPAKATAMRSTGLAADPVDDPPGWQQDPKCVSAAKHPYVVRVADVLPQLEPLVKALGGLGDEETRALKESLGFVETIIVGTYPVTYLMGDPDHEDPAGRFKLDYRNGTGQVGHDVGHFMLAVPKETAEHKQPFASIIWGHGTTLSDIETLVRAGFFARSGLATIAFDAPGHGLVLNRGQLSLARGLLWGACAVPWLDNVARGRARDLDGDGVADPGGLLWTSYVAHSRDNIRQTVLDAVQLGRVLRGFDGTARTDQDFDGNGAPDLAGDFDSNGIPDVGANAPIYTSGNSFGGVTSAIHGAIDPNVTAAAPISGGGGLTDIAARSYGVVDSVVEQILTPIVVAVPAPDRKGSTRCADSERSVRMVVNDLTQSRELEIACLGAAELLENMTVRVANASNGEVRCARTGTGGRFRVAFPASVGDRLEIALYTRPDAVRSYRGCEVVPDAPLGRIIRTWEQREVAYRPVEDPEKTCLEPLGCAQYRDVFYPVGSPLVAPQTGLGLRRNTPDLRKLLALTQSVLDSGDPINYVPYYSLRPAPGPGGSTLPPRGLLVANTVGDHFVVVATGNAMARAAGIVPFFAPSAAGTYPEYAAYATPAALWRDLGQRSPDDVLIDGWALEGNYRLARTPAGSSCAANYVPSSVCPGSADASPTTCHETLFDADWHSEGADRLMAQHPYPPLRLARLATTAVKDQATLEEAWAPRLLGTPFGPDDQWTPDGPVLGLVNAYVNPQGQHVWVLPNPCKAWDDSAYYDHLLGRFFATRGSDIYALSHPASHACLATQSCDFLDK